MCTIQNPSSQTEEMSGIMKRMWVELLTVNFLNFKIVKYLHNSRVCEIFMKTQDVQRFLNFFQPIKRG